MDLVSKNKVKDDAEEDKASVEDDWTFVSPNEGLPTLPESPEFELVCDKYLSLTTRAAINAKKKRNKKDILKSYAVVKPEEVPCEDWHSCEKCFSALIDNIPYIDECEEELHGQTTESATSSVHRETHYAEGAMKGKRNNLKRSAAMYQIYEAEEDKENRKMQKAYDKRSYEFEVMANEYICEHDRLEKERKIQRDIESSSLKYDYWDSYPKKSNNHRKSNPFPRQRIKESKFWGVFGDWRSLKKRFHYS